MNLQLMITRIIPCVEMNFLDLLTMCRMGSSSFFKNSKTFQRYRIKRLNSSLSCIVGLISSKYSFIKDSTSILLKIGYNISK